MGGYTWARIPDPVAQPDQAWAVTVRGERIAWAFERDCGLGHGWCIGKEGETHHFAAGSEDTFEEAKQAAERALTRYLSALKALKRTPAPSATERES